MKRANIVKEVRVIHVIVSALLFFSGVFLIAWPDIGGVAARWLVGANLILTGTVRMLGYFSNDLYRLAFQYDLAIGGLSAILGILIFIASQNTYNRGCEASSARGVCNLVECRILVLQTACREAEPIVCRGVVGLVVTIYV